MRKRKRRRTGRVEECSATSECIGLWPTYTSQTNSHVKDACRSRKTYLLSHPFNDLRMRRDPLLRHTHIPLFLTFFLSLARIDSYRKSVCRAEGNIPFLPTHVRMEVKKNVFGREIQRTLWYVRAKQRWSLQVKEKRERNSSIFREKGGTLISIK